MEDQGPKCACTLAGEPLQKYELEQLQTFLKIIRREAGVDTPAETFIEHLVTLYGIRPVTVEEVEESVADLKRHFAQAIPGAAHLCRQYPDLVAKHLPEGWTLAAPASQGNLKMEPKPEPEPPKADGEERYEPVERSYRAQLRRDIEFYFSSEYLETATLAFMREVLSIWHAEGTDIEAFGKITREYCS